MKITQRNNIIRVENDNKSFLESQSVTDCLLFAVLEKLEGIGCHLNDAKPGPSVIQTIFGEMSNEEVTRK